MGVVQAALIGSIIANLLLVLGLAFLVGGLKHGRNGSTGRACAAPWSMALACAALVLPSIATYTHSPAAEHATALGAAVVLIVMFALSLPSHCGAGGRRTGGGRRGRRARRSTPRHPGGRCGCRSPCSPW